MDYISYIVHYFTMIAFGNPTIHFAHRWQCNPFWSWNPRENNWEGYELWLVTSGGGEVRTRKEGDFLYSLKPGSCLAYRMGKNYYVTHDNRNPLAIYGIHFTLPRPLSHPDDLPEFRQFDSWELLAKLMDRVVLLHARGLCREAALYFRIALEEYIRSADWNEDGDPYSKAPLNRLVWEIRKRPDRHFTLDELARITHKSPNTLIRLVKKETGKSPMELQNTIKVDLAKQYLHASDTTLEKIAELLGYSDRYYFSRVFRKITGLPPGKYRRQMGISPLN